MPRGRRAAILLGVPVRLNLAALSDAELAALLGDEALQARYPEVSRARLEARPLPGPVWPLDPWVAPGSGQPGQGWGATPGQTRALNDLHAALGALGAAAQGPCQLSLERRFSHACGYLLGPDTAVTVRWDESPDGRDAPPFVEVLSWLRDDASGVEGVLTTNRPALPSPVPTELVAVRHLPGAALPELLEAHRLHLARHGRGLKLPAEGGWAAAWERLHRRNVDAWDRRGLLLRED